MSMKIPFNLIDVKQHQLQDISLNPVCMERFILNCYQQNMKEFLLLYNFNERSHLMKGRTWMIQIGTDIFY